MSSTSVILHPKVSSNAITKVHVASNGVLNVQYSMTDRVVRSYKYDLTSASLRDGEKLTSTAPFIFATKRGNNYSIQLEGWYRESRPLPDTVLGWKTITTFPSFVYGSGNFTGTSQTISEPTPSVAQIIEEYRITYEFLKDIANSSVIWDVDNSGIPPKIRGYCKEAWFCLKEIYTKNSITISGTAHSINDGFRLLAARQTRLGGTTAGTSPEGWAKAAAAELASGTAAGDAYLWLMPSGVRTTLANSVVWGNMPNDFSFYDVSWLTPGMKG